MIIYLYYVYISLSFSVLRLSDSKPIHLYYYYPEYYKGSFSTNNIWKKHTICISNRSCYLFFFLTLPQVRPQCLSEPSPSTHCRPGHRRIRSKCPSTIRTTQHNLTTALCFASSAARKKSPKKENFYLVSGRLQAVQKSGPRSFTLQTCKFLWPRWSYGVLGWSNLAGCARWSRNSTGQA